MKRIVLRKWVENLLIGVSTLVFSFIAMTIDNVLENPIYDKILVVSLIILIINGLILNKYGRTINED